MDTVFAAFDTGTVAGPDFDTVSDSLDWHPHPAFTGVALKHLVTGKDTDNRFSVHLVRLEPGAEIGHHVHKTNWELHEVVAGSGCCRLLGRVKDYRCGVVAVMPEGAGHSVHAGPDGLCLFAKFVPALA
jgi:quercetin dioxygenase-like cupin family protein